MSSLDFDYIVVGAGINGTWTAFHLAKKGYSTLLLEQVRSQWRKRVPCKLRKPTISTELEWHHAQS